MLGSSGVVSQSEFETNLNSADSAVAVFERMIGRFYRMCEML